MASDLHPDAQAYVERTEGGPPLSEQPLEELRAGMRERQIPAGAPEPVAEVRDVLVRANGHGIPVRLYAPEGEGPHPVLVWFHGGGFVFGDVDTEDVTARAMANAAGCLVASVDYRLAPEHPFPAPQRDAFAVLDWAAEHAADHGGDPAAIGVGGVSAGGTLAAASTHYARDRAGPEVGYQVLVVPAVNYSRTFPSHEEHGTEGSDWFDEQYLRDPLDGYNPYAYPLEAADFADLPPATVVTAGHDALRDEGRAYADALEAADVAVTRRHYDDMVHQFFAQLQEPEWERAREAVRAVGEDLRAHL